MKRIKILLALVLTAFASLASAQQTWTPLALEDGHSYYILNTTALQFLTETQTLSAGQPAAFTAHVAQDGTCSLTISDTKALCLTITANTGLLGGSAPKSVTAAVDTLATAFAVTESDGCYTFSTTTSWKYGLFDRNSASCTAHLSALIDSEAGTATLTASTATADTCSTWMLVSPDEFAKSGVARSEALKRLSAAIDAADAALKCDLPTITKTGITARQTASKTLRTAAQSSVSWISSRVTIEQINQSAQELEQSIADGLALLDYFAACKAEVDNVERLGGVAVSAACVTARGALAMSGSTSAMDGSMNVLRAALMLYLQAKELLPDSTDLTGVLTNPSFERGTMSGWNTMKVDASDLGSLSGIVSGGDLSGIADLVSLSDFDASSAPVVNEGDNAMANGHGRYYYMTEIPGSGLLSSASGQMVFQPIFGLPDGDYRITSQMYCKSGLLGTQSGYVSAIIIPGSVIKEVLGDIDLTKVTDMSYLAGLLLSNIGPLVQQSQVVNGSVKTKDAGKFGAATVDFRVEDGAFVLMVLNAGLMPIVGTDPYRADDVRLTYLQPIPVPGDVNGDRRFTIADIVAAISLIVNPEAEGLRLQAADTDGDGQVTEQDILKLEEMLLGEG